MSDSKEKSDFKYIKMSKTNVGYLWRLKMPDEDKTHWAIKNPWRGAYRYARQGNIEGLSQALASITASVVPTSSGTRILPDLEAQLFEIAELPAEIREIVSLECKARTRDEWIARRVAELLVVDMGILYPDFNWTREVIHRELYQRFTLALPMTHFVEVVKTKGVGKLYANESEAEQAALDIQDCLRVKLIQTAAEVANDPFLPSVQPISMPSRQKRRSTPELMGVEVKFDRRLMNDDDEN
jgi:hypothetical protein